MSKKQTAVSWLIEQLEQKGFDLKFNQDVIEQAKQLEKEQIVDAFDDGQANYSLPRDFETGKQYYSDTYE